MHATLACPAGSEGGWIHSGPGYIGGLHDTRAVKKRRARPPSVKFVFLTPAQRRTLWVGASVACTTRISPVCLSFGASGIPNRSKTRLGLVELTAAIRQLARARYITGAVRVETGIFKGIRGEPCWPSSASSSVGGYRSSGHTEVFRHADREQRGGDRQY